MRHVLSALVENKPGVLSRITGLFSRRGFNIESLAVAPTERSDLSRITAVIDADDVSFEQITKQLHKLVNVVKISDLAGQNSVSREVALVRVAVKPEERSQITEIVSIFKAKVADVGATQMTLEICGDAAKIEDLVSLLAPYGVMEIVRTGIIAIPRSAK